MNFYKLYNQLLIEAELPVPPASPGAAAGPADPAMGAVPSAAPAGATELPPSAIPPEDNIQPDSDVDSALPSQKRIQLIKLVAKALNSPSPLTKSGSSSLPSAPTRHKIISALNKQTTDGNVQGKENIIIKAIAFLQGVDEKSISAEIDFIDASTNEDDGEKFRYIPIDQYVELVDLASEALLSDRDALTRIDKNVISASDITSDNAEEHLKTLQSILN